MENIRVVLVDDHEIVRLGLKHLLEQFEGIQVVADARSTSEALLKVEETHPDIVIMDVRMQDGSGIDACRKINKDYPAAKVIILTSYGEEDLVLEAILAGAKGYVLKEVGNEQIIRAIKAVHRGESLLDTTVTKRLLEHMRRTVRKGDDELDQLTDRERKVLVLVAKGKTNKEIAETIYLSEKTVRNYVSSILGKLKLTNRTEAAAYAMRHEFIK